MPRSSWIPGALRMRDLPAVASLSPKSTQPDVRPTSPRGLVGDLDSTLTGCEPTVASDHARVAEAERDDLVDQAEERYMHEVKRLYKTLHARTLEVDTLKCELTHAYSGNQENLVKIESLQSENGMLRKDFERAREGEALATRGLRELEQRVASLEEVLRTAKQKQAESVSAMEVAQAQSSRLFDANRLLRLDLQQSIEQVTRAHEVPCYSASLNSVGEPAPACVEDIAWFRREIQERKRRLDREIAPASVPAGVDLVIPSTSASAHKAVLPRAPAHSVKPPPGSAPLHRRAQWRALDACAVSFTEVDRLDTSLSSARSYA